MGSIVGEGALYGGPVGEVSPRGGALAVVGVGVSGSLWESGMGVG